jgi:hypothetical protein
VAAAGKEVASWSDCGSRLRVQAISTIESAVRPDRDFRSSRRHGLLCRTLAGCPSFGQAVTHVRRQRWAEEEFEMFQYRSVLTLQIRRGAFDWEIGRDHAMSQCKLAQFRSLATVQGWSDAKAPLPDEVSAQLFSAERTSLRCANPGCKVQRRTAQLLDPDNCPSSDTCRLMTHGVNAGVIS